MFAFEKEQKIFDIAGVKIGGQLAELPTVLVGSVFYHGHNVVKDEEKGLFDKEKTEDLINRQDEFSERTGNPNMIDVVGVTPDALRRHIDFVSSVTEAPILMDGVTSTNNIAGLEYVKEIGLTNRIVYNSLTLQYKQAEMEKIKEVGLESAILLALNMRDLTSKGRVTAIRELLTTVTKAGITKPLVDTCVLDIPSLGLACKALFNVKNEFGLPAGCGAHNAISTWRGLKAKMGKQAVKPCIASANVMPISAGANFVLYGPIESAEFVFPSIAMVDAAYAQTAMEIGKTPVSRHPIFRIA